VGDETCPDLSKERYAMTSHSTVGRGSESALFG
jgi:hypothetical protein